MSNNLKFSVGIPAFKSQYLEECISSILNQTFSEFELIIVNDCSPHPVDEVVERFASDSRIRYFKNERNIGAEKVADNFNKCFEKAKGEFFILMGDDDKMAVNYLEEILILINKYPNLDVFHCRSIIIDEKSNPTILTPSWPEFESVYDNIWHRIHENRIQFIADFTFRTSALKESGGFFYLPLGWGTDDITAYMLMKDKGVAHTNTPLLNYRMHSNNITSSGNLDLKMEAMLIQHDWLKSFLEKKPNGEYDLIMYNNICKNLNKLTQKQKIYLMSDSFGKQPFKNILKWIYKRRKFKVSVPEILYSMIIYLKSKNVKKYTI